MFSVWTNEGYIWVLKFIAVRLAVGWTGYTWWGWWNSFGTMSLHSEWNPLNTNVCTHIRGSSITDWNIAVHMFQTEDVYIGHSPRNSSFSTKSEWNVMVADDSVVLCILLEIERLLLKLYGFSYFIWFLLFSLWIKYISWRDNNIEYSIEL